jgi:hypothetical protein
LTCLGGGGRIYENFSLAWIVGDVFVSKQYVSVDAGTDAMEISSDKADTKQDRTVSSSSSDDSGSDQESEPEAEPEA